MKTNLSEVDIKIALSKGDFSQIYKEFAPLIRKFLVSPKANLSVRWEDLDDVVQDTFANALRSYKTFKGESKFSSWLCTIARYTVFSRSRTAEASKRKNDNLSLTDLSDTLVDLSQATPSAQYLTESQELISKVLRYISEETNPEYAEAFSLVVLEEMKYTEVAEICAIPIGTVRSRVFRAREVARKFLETNT